MFDRNLLQLTGVRGVLAALAVSALLQAGFVIGRTVGLADAICAFREGGQAGAFSGIAAFAACFVAVQVVRFLQETALERYARNRARELRSALLERAFSAESLLVLHIGADRFCALAEDGSNEVEAYLRIIPPKIIGILALALPLLAAEFAFDWPSGVVCAVMFPVIMFFMVLLGRQARDRSERQYVAYTRLTSQFMDALRGVEVLRLFGASRAEAERVRENGEKVRAATVRTLRMATLSSAVLDVCATFGVAAVAILLAFRLMDGSTSLFTGLVALVLASEYFSPIRSFASDYHASLDGKNALADMLACLKAGADSPRSEAGTGTEPPHPDFVSIELDEVSFAHGISDVTMRARFGEKVGIIGKSGAGKTTLANILAGFSLPASGRIAVDGTPTDLTGDWWRRQVRYIPQNPYVFRAPLLDNIRFYRPSASREEALAVAHAVGLDALIAELADGIDTVVGEGARGLSGGEAHRIALARILLDDDARVLVFDEPTAHLDIETERDLKGAMLEVMEGKLVFFATHRLHWLDEVDRVIALDEGRTVSEQVRP